MGSLLERHAVANVRRVILAQSGVHTAAVGSASKLVLGGWLVKKPLVVLGILVLTVVAVWLQQRGAVEEPANDVVRVAPAMTPETHDLDTVATTAPVAERVDVGATPASRYPPIQFRGRVLDPSGAPLAGVRVSLCFADALGDPAPWMRFDSLALDDAGRFETTFSKRYIDEYTHLHVRVVDHATLVRRFDLPGETMARAEGVDLGDLRLERGSRLHGRVIDAGGRPVSGARILLLDLLGGSHFLPELAVDRVETADDGSFEIDHVRTSGPSSHRVFAIGPAGCGGSSFAIASGETVRDVEIVVAANASLLVRVEEHDGSPAIGAPVFALPVDVPFGGGRHAMLSIPDEARMPPVVKSTFYRETDEQGVAVFDALPSGFGCWIFVGTRFELPGSAKCEPLVAGELREQRVVLEPPRADAPLRTIRGRVQDEFGNSVPDIEVVRHLSLNATPREPQARTLTDANGRFEFAGVRSSDPCVVWVRDSRFERRVTTIDFGKKDRDPDPIEVLAARAHPIRGVVVDQEGVGIPDARVHVQVALQNGRTGAVSADDGRTDATGHFNIQDAGEHASSIQVKLPGDRSLWREPHLVASVAPGATNVRIVAERIAPGTATIEIEVIDALSRTSLPIRFVETYAFDRGIGSPKKGGPDPSIELGRIRYEKWREGRFRASITLVDERRAEIDFEVGPGGDRSRHEIRLQLPIFEAVAVNGRVVAIGKSAEELSTALRRASIVVCDEDGTNRGGREFEPGTIELLGNPTFRLERLPPRTVRVQLWSEDSLLADRLFDARNGGESSLDLFIEPFGKLEFQSAEPVRTDVRSLRLIDPQGSRPDYWIHVEQTAGTSVPAGTWRYEWWNVTFIGVRDLANRRAEVIADGEITIVAGETTVFDPPAPRR